MKMKKFSKVVLMAGLALCLFVMAGCGSDAQKAADNDGGSSVKASTDANAPAAKKADEPKADKKEAPAKKTMTIKVYYPDDQAMNLIGSERTIDYTDSDKYTAAVEALMQAPDADGQNAIIPKQAKLNGVAIDGDTATVDFSSDLKKHFVGGSAGEEMLVGSVVDTLTQFPEIKKVQITMDGKKFSSLAGHMDFSDPFTRMDDLIQK